MAKRLQISLRAILAATAVCALAVFPVSYWLRLPATGIRVIVTNSGREPLRSVELFVTGNTYALGDLAPGASAERVVEPKSESHLSIRLPTVDGSNRELDAGGYFEPGYRGEIRVSIAGEEIVENLQEIHLW